MDDQDSRLGDTAEGSEGVFDSMHLEQDEDEFFTFEQVREAADPSDIGLTSSFTAQTQSLNFPSRDTTDGLFNTTNQVIGIANAWSIGAWFKTVVPNIGTQFLFVLAAFPDIGSRINLYHDASSESRLRFDWSNEDFPAGPVTEVTAFNGYYGPENGNWVHTLATWDGTTLRMFKNGVNIGAPNVGSATPAGIAQLDEARSLGLGNVALGGNSSVIGNIAQLQMWRVDITQGDTNPVAADLQSTPSLLNLNGTFGAYTFASDLAHWWRPGHEAAPNIGRDYSEAGFTPTIDIGANAVGVADGDRQADVP